MKTHQIRLIQLAFRIEEIIMMYVRQNKHHQ
jgi:hypothetical protein